jgi:pimeloyl-ACP methyl ester carboxylesterase
MGNQQALDYRDVQLPAGTLRYLDVGRGPIILFVHGFLTNSRLWLPVVERVQTQFRCIVPDWPLGSHSLPMKADADLSQPGLVKIMGSFVEALGTSDLIVVGNDMGGALSQQFTAAFPQQVQRLVLTPCDVFANFPPGIFKFLIHLPKLPGAAALMANLVRLTPLRRTPITYGWLAKHGLTDETLWQFIRPIIENADVRRDAVNVIKQATPKVLEAIRPQLAAFDKPVDIVWPPEEKVFPYSDAEILKRTFPNARLHPISDSYTFVSLDQPEALANVLLGNT